MPSATLSLVAVQARVQVENYLTEAAFRQKIMTLTEEAVSGLSAAPTLVAFPEAIGFPLLLGLGTANAANSQSVVRAALELAKHHWRALLQTALRYRRIGPSTFFLWRALPAFKAYHDTFAEAARTFGVTIVAGSSFLPYIEQEAARGLHVAHPDVHNTAFTFGPTGALLGRSDKRYLTRGLESRIGLKSSPLAQLYPLHTPVGRVGVAICLDGFYSSVLERLDGLGTQVVVQPSANFALWDRPWPADTRLSEGEAWLKYGLRQQVQNRLNVQVGLNPMLVADLWDLQARGRSSIVVNRRYHPGHEAAGHPGLVALADTSDKEAWVKAELDLKPALPTLP